MSMAPRPFYVWTYRWRGLQPVPPDRYPCNLGVEDVPQPYKLFEDAPLAKGWPKDASYWMARGDPRHTLLLDAHPFGRVKVISRRLKDLVAAFGAKDLEFLPVAIKDMRRKIASKDYFIPHGAPGLDWPGQGSQRARLPHDRKDEDQQGETAGHRREARPEEGARLLRPRVFRYPAGRR
jgi:hypothetical protein